DEGAHDVERLVRIGGQAEPREALRVDELARAVGPVEELRLQVPRVELDRGEVPELAGPRVEGVRRVLEEALRAGASEALPHADRAHRVLRGDDQVDVDARVVPRDVESDVEHAAFSREV